ncbi:hypothetical protein AVEN_214588-1 [Araneus ventricosus]|uniref:Tc1-like transposase DDE domain-containing protein n=1 Tax=Araneus ventricosus TaxID=182803 RepID=A0A4Y2IC18_ARAVE|nr:hypothetical protein AVEN_214588-1 [Araneus ventricosus]
MLLRPARSPDLSPIEHVWDIIGRQLQRHTQPAITVPVLTDQAQQAWNSIPQTDIRHFKTQFMYVYMLAFKILTVTPERERCRDINDTPAMDLMHVTSHPPTRDLPEAAISQS